MSTKQTLLSLFDQKSAQKEPLHMIKNQGGTLGFGGILTLFWQNSSSKYTFYRSKGVQFHGEKTRNLDILQKMWKKVLPA
jgi:hypothetical protein